MANIALVYDACYTLLDGYNPSAVLERRGMNVDEFWQNVLRTQKREEERGDKTTKDIIYLALFMNEVRYGQLQGLTMQELQEAGTLVDKWLYPGLPEFFPALKRAHPDSRISHTVVSAGLKPTLEGTVLAEHMDHIFGYSFFDDLTEGDAIDEVKSTSSSVEKIHAIVTVSQGETNGSYEFPIRNMIYIGDGQTDIPAFRFVKKRGGLTICVYNPEKEGAEEKALKLKKDVAFVLPADYRRAEKLWGVVNGFMCATELDE